MRCIKNGRRANEQKVLSLSLCIYILHENGDRKMAGLWKINFSLLGRRTTSKSKNQDRENKNETKPKKKWSVTSVSWCHVSLGSLALNNIGPVFGISCGMTATKFDYVQGNLWLRHACVNTRHSSSCFLFFFCRRSMYVTFSLKRKKHGPFPQFLEFPLAIWCDIVQYYIFLC